MIFRFYNFFCSGHFLIIFPKIKDQKMTGAKKLLKLKITFFMPVNHAKEFLKSVHNEALFSHLFFRTLIEVRSLNFKAKFLKVVAINSEFLIVSMVDPAPVSPAHWLV